MTKPVPGMRAAWVALALLTLLNLFNFLDRYILPGVQPLVQREFHVSDERMGALTFAFFITYMIAAPLTGWLGDHFPRKPLIIAGALIWSVSTLFTAFVHSYDELYFRHAIVGIGEASFSIFAPALLSDFWPEEQRNRILTIFYLSLPVGAALGYIVGGTLGNAYGWRAPFYVSAVPGILLAGLIFFFMREPKRGASEHLAPTKDRATYAGLFRNRAYWTATLGMAMMVFSLGGISVWMPTFLYRNAHYSLPAANQLLGVITVVDGIAGTWFGGWLAQRWLRTNHSALYLISAWSVLLAIPAAVFTFFGPRSVMVPSLAVAEFMLFLNTGPLNAAIVNAVSAPVRSTAIAIELFVIHAIGDAPSPRIIGWISDHSSLPMGLALTLVTMLLSGGLLLLGARYAPPVDPALVETGNLGAAT
ncbi:MAG TPA: MFS transporter [Acidobacteriaceae bacterium]|jgi:MFS family permease|nr:MFS transporter [Acidobacteriaceae bacterium]